MTLASLAKLAPALVKDDGLDVAGWNASPVGKLHPRDHDGQFRDRMDGVLRSLINGFGDLLAHEEIGEADHHFNDHGSISLHQDGEVVISRIDDEGEPVTVAAGISHQHLMDVQQEVEESITALKAGDLAPGTHLDWTPEDENAEQSPVTVGYGVMSDGTKYVSLTGDEGESLQFTAESADDLLSQIEDIRSQQERYNDNRGDPFIVRPLAPGENLERRKGFTSASDFDLAAGLVSGPEGHRLRLGITGNDDYPVSKWSGGQGPMTADLGPTEARELDEALRTSLIDLDGYEGALNEADEAFAEWSDTPSGQRFAELVDQGWSMLTSERGTNVERHTGTYPNRTFVAAPPDIEAEYRALFNEQEAIWREHNLVDEGDVFAAQEVPTAWGTIRIELVGNTLDHHNPAEAKISIRPPGVDADKWEDDVVSAYSAHADYSAKQLRAIRKLVGGYLTAAQQEPITKSEGAAMDVVYAWAPITKVEQQPNGTVMVYGPVSDAGLDRDKQRMNQAWLDQHVPQWMAEGANVREMHDPKRAVGVGFGLTRDPSGAHLLSAVVTDPVAAMKCMPGPNGPDGKPLYPPTLKGFSIGIKEPRLDMSKAEAPNGEIVGGYICEVSLVDRPANPRTMFTMVKADTAEGGLALVEEPEVVEAGESEGEPNPWEAPYEPEPDAPKVDRPTVRKRDFSARQRRKAAKSGAAMENESFPIYNAQDLKNAIHLVGNAKDPAAARRHIISRARALGLVAQLPEDWGITKADAVVADLVPMLQLDELHKYDEAADIANATKAMALIARLIASEAAELAKGREEEADDIRILLDAHKALCWFKCREENQAGQGDGTTPVEGACTPSDVDMTKDSPAMGYKTESPELTKAVAERQQAEERAKDLETQVAQLKADMAAMPKPGGPVLTKTAQAVRTTQETNQRQNEAALLLAKADRADDPVLVRGYRDRARALLKADS